LSVIGDPLIRLRAIRMGH